MDRGQEDGSTQQDTISRKQSWTLQQEPILGSAAWQPGTAARPDRTVQSSTNPIDHIFQFHKVLLLFPLLA